MHCLSCSPSQAEPVLSRDGSRLDDDFTKVLCVPQVLVDDNWLFLLGYVLAMPGREDTVILLFRLL